MEVHFWIPGVPPNWSNQSMNRYDKHKRMREWQDWAISYGDTARRAYSLPRAENTHERRVIKVVCHRQRLMDREGNWSSVKPIVDGLQASLRRGKKVGTKIEWYEIHGAGLIFKDDEKHIDISVEQVKKETTEAERIEVTITW